MVPKFAEVVQVVVVSGDDDPSGFASTITGLPFIAVPFEELAARKPSIESKIPCRFFPQPAVVDAKTGTVLFGASEQEAEVCIATTIAT
jgi:hypothetical protein